MTRSEVMASIHTCLSKQRADSFDMEIKRKVICLRGFDKWIYFN